MTSLQDFRAGWFLDMLILDSYLLSTQASLGQKLGFQAFPCAVGNVWLRLQNRWTFTEFYILRNLSKIWSSVHPVQLSLLLSYPDSFLPSPAGFNTYGFDSLALSSGKTRYGTSLDIRCGNSCGSDTSPLAFKCLFDHFFPSTGSYHFFFWWQDLPKCSLWVNTGCRTQALPQGTEQCQAQPPPGSHRSPEAASVACTGEAANTGVAPNATSLLLPLELIVVPRMKSEDMNLMCRP